MGKELRPECDRHYYSSFTPNLNTIRAIFVWMTDTTGVFSGIENQIAAFTGSGHGATDLLLGALLVVASVVIAKIIKHILADLAPHLVKQTQTTLDDELLKAVNGPLQWLIVAMGLYLALHEISSYTGFMNDYVDRLLIVTLIFIAAYLLANLVNGLLNWYKNDIAPKTSTDLDDMLVPFLKKISGATISVIALLVALEQMKIVEITPLITGMGIAGIAVAFAAKEFLSDFFGAISILADRPYTIGDKVKINNIEAGEVKEIGLRSTRIKTADNRVIIVPNALVSKSRIINYAMPDSIIVFNINVGIAYDADLDRAQHIMTEIALGTDGVLKDPPPRVYVTELGKFSVKLLMHVYAASYNTDWPVLDNIYREIVRQFAAEGIEIPYPITSIHVKRDGEAVAIAPLQPATR